MGTIPFVFALIKVGGTRHKSSLRSDPLGSLVEDPSDEIIGDGVVHWGTHVRKDQGSIRS